MIKLDPSPRSLGLHSPVIGPWFSDAAVRLGLPDADLAVPLTLGSDIEWRPPAAGFLSFFIATPERPAGLARLRAPSGAPAFTDGALVAVFELLPQASERLAALMRSLPTLGNPSAEGRATRPPVRAFALEFTDGAQNLAFLKARLPEGFGFPPSATDDAKKLGYLGLSSSGGTMGNGPTPMRDLLRPGKSGGKSQALLRFPNDTPVRLWAFDRRGRALDPGAVACWWLYLATHAENGYEELFAAGLDEDEQRTAPLADDAGRLLVQLVNAHEGPLTDETLARLEISGNAEGDGTLRYRGSQEEGGIDIAFTAAPDDTPDPLPVPRMAVLPDGRFESQASLFADGPVDPLLQRDQVRVVVLSIEHHLTGQPRHADDAAAAAVKRRAADQQRETTRVNVERAARPALLATPNDVAAAVIEVLTLKDPGAGDGAGSADGADGADGAGEGTAGSDLAAHLVAEVLAVDFGPTGGALASVPVPDEISVSAAALVGGGTAVGGTVAGQRALLTVEVGAAAAGAWVRAWTQGFDHRKGERFRLDGGAGIADAEGRARIVVPLPDGAANPEAPLGADVLVVTATGHRLFADQRFPRPEPVGGEPSPAGSAQGPFLLCEEGRETSALNSAAAVRSGTTIVALGGSAPQLVDPASVPTEARAEATFIRAAGAGDTIRLTQPAFSGQPAGDTAALLGAGGADIRRTERRLPSAWTAGFPLPGMRRLELVAAAGNENVSLAVIGGGAAIATRHALPPHHLGHPLCPAGADVAGVGAKISGPAVRGVLEYARERTAANTAELAASAATELAVPAAPESDSLWVAGLRTVAAGVEAEVGLSQLLSAVFDDAYPFGAALADIRSFLAEHDITLPAGLADPGQRIARALDRRFLAAARGAREGATALIAALRRAEDFVYIETPALDDRSFGGSDDTIHLLNTLIERMDQRRGLRVVICMPVFADVGIPAALQRVRDQETRTALDRLAAGDREPRVAVFSPAAGPGRSLKLATTTVIVDDAWALVGTTHLWRRGLSYDSSYAVSVFDDRLEDGRPQELLRFRRCLLANRLGVEIAELPDDPVELTEAVRALSARGGFGRLAADRIRPPQEEASTLRSDSAFTEADVWNPDGSPPNGLNPLVWALQLLPGAVSEDLATP